MSVTVWYISKYVAIPPEANVGVRSFMLLREMAKAGHECLILTSDSNHLNPMPKVTGRVLKAQTDGVTVYWLRTLKFTRAKSLKRILSWLDFEWKLWRLPKRDLPRPDVVIVSSLSLLTVLNGLWLKRKYGCRLVFEIRDIWPLTIIEEGGFSPRNPFVMGLAAIERLGYRKADAVVGTMPNLVEHVDAVAPQHAPVHCIPFGVSDDMLEAPQPLSEDWINQHVPDEKIGGKFVVCHAGAIGISNALEPLLACARSMKDIAGVHFLIVGDGDLRERYQAECADLPNITFTGRIPKPMVQSVLGLCDLLYFSVQPSAVWNYGLSLNKIIDYMLAAKPILASYSGYPNMVEEAEAGVSVPADDVEALEAEILRLSALPKVELSAMGQRGRDWLLRNRQYRDLAQAYLKLALPGRI